MANRNPVPARHLHPHWTNCSLSERDNTSVAPAPSHHPGGDEGRSLAILQPFAAIAATRLPSRLCRASVTDAQSFARRPSGRRESLRGLATRLILGRLPTLHRILHLPQLATVDDYLHIYCRPDSPAERHALSKARVRPDRDSAAALRQPGSTARS